MRYRVLSALLACCALVSATFIPLQADAVSLLCNVRCYARGGYGPYYGFGPTPVNAVGVSLDVDCLVSGSTSDQAFVNWEMWIWHIDPTTRISHWLEEGMTDGTLPSSPGQGSGFVWFWADYRPNSVYFEHFISNAFVKSYTNISFYGEGGGN